MARKPTLFCQVEPELKALVDVRRAQDRTTMQAVITDLASAYLNSEQRHPCRHCGSTTYPACNHVQIMGIPESVLKTEQSLHSGTFTGSIESLPAEAVEFARSWVVAQQVQGDRWRDMLRSIERQLQIVKGEADDQRARTDLGSH